LFVTSGVGWSQDVAGAEKEGGERHKLELVLPSKHKGLLFVKRPIVPDPSALSRTYYEL